MTTNSPDELLAAIDTSCQAVPARGVRWAVWLLAAFLVSLPDRLEGSDIAWRETFDAPEVSWSLQLRAEGRIDAQSRKRVILDGEEETFESLTIVGRAGYSTYIEHAVPRAPLIDELEFELRVRSPAPGVQIGVEVVCPRSTEAGQPEPPRLLVTGTRYTQPTRWQVLQLGDINQAARRQARLQKTRTGRPYDLQEAYIDRVVVLVPTSGSRATVVEIDELTVKGVVFGRVTPKVIQRASHDGSPAGSGPLLEGPLVESVLQPHQAPPAITPVQILRQGDSLAVEGSVFIPRVVTHRGEPFATLAELGFNTVWLDHVPTAEERAQAHRARLWLIAPPPPALELQKLAAETDWQSVLAWSLGRDRLAIHIDAIRSQAEAIRASDRALQRPLLVEARDRRHTYGQLADILVDPRRVRDTGGRGTSEPHRRLLGCVGWVSIEPRLSPLAQAQVATFAPHRPELHYHDPFTVRELALRAAASGSRGIVIRTGEPLTSKQPSVRNLITQLELMHRELALLEPWLVGGKSVGGTVVDLSEEAIVHSWQLERARIVLVLPHALPTPVPSPSSMTLTVAGVSETVSAHLVTPAGLIPLEVRRVTGGLRVFTGDLTGGAMVLLTDDSRAITQLRQHTANHAERCAKGERDLAMADLMALDESQGAAHNRPSLASALEATKAVLQQCDLLLASRDYARAFQLARNLRNGLLRSFKEAPDRILSSRYDHESWPLEATPIAWSNYLALRQAVDSLPRGPNVLPAADFERLEAVRSSGWTHLNYASPAWKTAVELVADTPKHGTAHLRLSATSVPGQLSDVASTQALVWISSPEIPLPQGTTVEITGWARVATSDDGQLIVADSLGGDDLALRIGPTSNWQAFRSIRAVDASGKISLQLALYGPGRADVDAVMIRQVVPPKSNPQATTATTSANPRQ